MVQTVINKLASNLDGGCNSCTVFQSQAPSQQKDFFVRHPLKKHSTYHEREVLHAWRRRHNYHLLDLALTEWCEKEGCQDIEL